MVENWIKNLRVGTKKDPEIVRNNLLYLELNSEALLYLENNIVRAAQRVVLFAIGRVLEANIRVEITSISCNPKTTKKPET